MAISGTYDFRGLPVVNAYVQARNLVFVGKTRVKFTAIVWTSAAASLDPEAMAIDNVPAQMAFDLTASDNVYAQCYAELLTLPQFAGFHSDV